MRGMEWVVEAHGCSGRALASAAELSGLFDALVEGLALHPVAPAMWHQFPAAEGCEQGGITGLCLLAESHIACHTFPEHGSLCLNVFCCREREAWDFERELRERFSARSVSVRRIERPYCP